MTCLIMPICFPRPYVDESPISYLIRVAEANSYKQISWLFSQDGPPFVLSPERLLTQLLEAKWTGFDKVSEAVHKICNLDVSNLNISSMRYCPKCIEEEPYHRAKWYLTGSVVCLDHGCWLVDECPECHSKIVFRENLSVTNCNCGAPLLSAETQGAPKSAIRYERFFSGLEPLGSDEFGFYGAFDGRKYTLEFRVKLIRTLMRWCLSSSEFFHKTGCFAGLNTIAAAKLTIDSFSQSWLSSNDDFESFLATLHQKICHDQAEGDELFRHFYKKVFRDLVHPELKPIKDAIQSYMNDHWIHALDKRNSLFVMEAISSHKWLALQAASRELDVPKSFIRQGIESGDIRYQLKKKESRELILVHRDDVIKLTRAEKSYVNAMAASSLLGVTKGQMNDLTKSGMVKREMRPGSPPSGSYSLDDLQNLMGELNSKLMTVEQDLIPLSEAIRKIGNGIKDPFVTLVKAILSGEIRAQLDPNAIGFRRLRIDSDELKTWYLEKTRGDTAEYFTMQTLRAYFQVSSDLIPQLVNKGLISRVRKPIRDSSRVITIEAVNQFKERYVLLSKLSLCCSASSAALMKRFEAGQVFPIDHDWKIEDRFVQKIYYRHELLSIPEVQVFISSMADWEYESF